MASLILGTSSVASQRLSLSSPLSFSHSASLSGVFLSSTPATSISISSPSPALPSIYCGRGDRKTAKGKRFNHSFGNARPRDKKKGRGPPKSLSPPAAPKKDPFDSGEVVKIEITDE